MKKLSLMLLLVVSLTFALAGCGGGGGEKKAEAPKDAPKKAEAQVLNIYSWADYFDPQVLAEFLQPSHKATKAED